VNYVQKLTANSNVLFAKTDFMDAPVRTYVPMDAFPAISIMASVSDVQRVILDKIVKNCVPPVAISPWDVTQTAVV
jgi:hypothetical protein